MTSEVRKCARKKFLAACVGAASFEHSFGDFIAIFYRAVASMPISPIRFIIDSIEPIERFLNL
jgi:hypothetical protein